MATAKLKGAEADYQLAVLHKRLSLIRAPFSGILGRIPNKAGSLIEPSDLLTSLSDNSKVFAYFNISETDYLDFRLHPERFSQNSTTACFGEWRCLSCKRKDIRYWWTV